MGFAEAADVPVALVGDIDRGGVIASLVGTAALLSTSERERVAGYIVNRFRGDVSLFDSGIEAIAQRTGLRCLGIVPFFAAASRLPAEDSVGINQAPASAQASGRSGSRCRYCRGSPISMIWTRLLPSRASRSDSSSRVRHYPAMPIWWCCQAPRQPSAICGLCALRAGTSTCKHTFAAVAGCWACVAATRCSASTVRDPSGVEGEPAVESGLGLLDVDTELAASKQLAQVNGVDRLTGETVRGYEMHVGKTTGPATANPMLELGGRSDGAVSTDGKVMGCYLHGLFAADAFRNAFLSTLGKRGSAGPAYEAQIEATLDALAQHLESNLDLDAILQISRQPNNRLSATSAPAHR